LKALIELRAGKPAAASADAAFRADATTPRVVATKAAVLLAGGDAEGALRLLQDLAPMGPAEAPPEKAAVRCRDGYVYYLQGHILYGLGRFAEAHAALSRAAELENSAKGTQWSEGFLAAGAAALKARTYEEAVRSYMGAVKAEDGSAPAHAGLGLAYLGLVGRDDEADRELRRALALDPKCLEAHLGLGYLANRQKREVEAISYFERGSALFGGSSYAAAALSKLRAGRGEQVDFYAFDGPDLPAGWRALQNQGVLAEVRNGKLVMSGKQKVAGRDTRVLLQMDARRFARLEADLEAEPKGGTAAGLFVASPRGFVELGLLEGGKAGWRVKNMGGFSAPEDIGEWPKLPGGSRARLAIEVLDAGQGRVRLHFAGRAVKDLTVDTLGNVAGYEVGVFCRAQGGDDLNVSLDNAALVTRKAEGDAGGGGK
jgi:tetratricopeptide (TPR) repeat protein